MAEGDALGDELADHDVEVRDHEEGERERQTSVAGIGSKMWAKTGSPRAPMARLVMVTPSCIAAMNRGGLAVIRRTRRARLVALVAELGDAGAPRRDEAVFGRDEEGVQQEQACDREELEEESHAPLSGARVLGGWSSSNGDRL